MAELSLDEALDVLNTARAYLNPEAVDIHTFGLGRCQGVDVDWMSQEPDGPLSEFFESILDACDVITDALDPRPAGGGEPVKSKLTLTEDHRSRWVLVPIT